MRPGPAAISGLMLGLSLGCSAEEPEARAEPGAQPAPEVAVHYLGHASFLLTFGEASEEAGHAPGPQDGLTVLTDYGASMAYGLDSPVHPLGEILPDIATFSHEHDDHAGGVLPEGIPVILTGGAVPGGAHPAGPHQEGDLTITPIPTFEGGLEAPDNVSFLFEYRGLKVLHLGDCQGLMTAGSDPETRDTVRSLYRDHYDLVLLPIGFVRNILAEAAEFTPLLDARRIVPMHFWSPADRDAYLEMMGGREDASGRPYLIRAEDGAEIRIRPGEGDPAEVEVVGLTPKPPPHEGRGPGLLP